MNRDGFCEFLRARKLAEDKIEAAVELVARFEAFVAAAGPQTATAEDANAFAAELMRLGLNTEDNFLALARYGRFTGNNDVYVAVVLLLDGAEAMEGLHRRAGEVLGADKRDQLFAGIDLPPLGLPNAEKVKVTRAVMARLEQMADAATCHRILSVCLRHLEDEWYLDERQKYLECSSVDAFLDRNEREYLAMLAQLRDEGKLYFSQPITDEVIAYVSSHPELSRGVRQGNVLYEVKIPHMAVEYLAETDPQMKRYYYCHCPWVKEALRSGNPGISARFCDCSAGFHKKRWEVIFGRPLEAEIMESVLQGDMWCKIAIHLPVEAIV